MSSNRLRLTWSEKVAILEKAARSPSVSYSELAEWAVEEFGLLTAPGKTTICRLLKPSAVLRGRPVKKAVRKKAQSIERYILSQNMMFALDRLGEGLDNPYNVDQLTALLWCEAAWSKVSASTIQRYLQALLIQADFCAHVSAIA
ncbi:uncharacterized protein PITG_06085 [Phytophthora infestans T30-4]|uniref:Uncharacterized protein n=1 Tax=Phytophthora infestans (strain T30-4) TaxID=403677 RepID=D0N6D0_PHYIT|nr:uncharacterized protein PITG_06085 [Phytophthora infestans T30-4]EEY70621.1 hypothetical protein PITG_06085 [Phytophthora infestans T30-4]|eukprot:XP_002998275.1 hypothetical protein PITG_06085 [Phytophthora infestans T30-4]